MSGFQIVRGEVLAEPYCYVMTREIAAAGRSAAIIVDHPPFAGIGADAAVMRKLYVFVGRFGIARLAVVPLFAHVTDRPWRLGKAKDPVGPLADAWTERAIAGADIVIVAWGTPFALPLTMRQRWRDVAAIVATSGKPVFSLGAPCGDGHPPRPQDRAIDTPLVPWTPPR